MILFVSGLLAMAVIIGVIIIRLSVFSKNRKAPRGPIGSDAADATAAAHENAEKSLPRMDNQDIEDARRGLIAVPSGTVTAPDGSVVWDFDRFSFVDGDAPVTVNPSLWQHAKLNRISGLFKVTDGVYQLRGFDTANLELIEGKTGWIVIDTLSCRETAQRAMAFARQHLGNRSVSAIIFTHSHVDHFGGALGVLSIEEAHQRRVPIVAPAGFMKEATSENILVGPAMGRRATWQFGQHLTASDRGLVDSGIGSTLAFGGIGILPPSVTIDQLYQELTLDGVRFAFQNTPDTEAPSEMAFYLPDFNAYCGAELMNQTMHQILTLRGAKCRDALRWAGSIDDALLHFGQAEIYFGVHNWPVFGNARIVAFMKKHRDTYKYIHDQTVRMINAGMKPDEIAAAIRLPASLAGFAGVRGYYGTVSRNARAVYQYYLGWFDGNPAHMDPLPRQEAARRYVALMGGVERVIAAADEAFRHGDYRWAAELLNHVVFSGQDTRNARELLASSYDQMGYSAESAIDRNTFLMAAMELRAGKNMPGADPARAAGLLEQMPAEYFLVSMEAALNGPAAENAEQTINLVFSDTGESFVLWIENAVLHHRAAPPDKDANATLTITRGLLIKVITGEAGINDLIGGEVSVTGSKLDLIRFLSLLKKPARTFPIVTPAH